MLPKWKAKKWLSVIESKSRRIKVLLWSQLWVPSNERLRTRTKHIWTFQWEARLQQRRRRIDVLLAPSSESIFYIFIPQSAQGGHGYEDLLIQSFLIHVRKETEYSAHAKWMLNSIQRRLSKVERLTWCLCMLFPLGRNWSCGGSWRRLRWTYKYGR